MDLGAERASQNLVEGLERLISSSPISAVCDTLGMARDRLRLIQLL
jgi:hypothetical protein